MLGGRPAPLLFDWKEFQRGEHFLLRFFAIEKNEHTKSGALTKDPKFEADFG